MALNALSRTILVGEVVLAFGPILIFFMLGAIGTPFIVWDALSTGDLNALLMLVWVALGASGIAGFYLLFDYTLFERPESLRQLHIAYALCGLGLVALGLFTYFALRPFSATLLWVSVAPLLVTLHFGGMAYRAYYANR